MLALDTVRGELRIGQTRLSDFAPAHVRAALGPPDRVETTETRERYEEHGMGEVESTSVMLPVTWTHRIYDARSLTFESSESEMSSGRTRLRVFLEHPRQFDNVRAPQAVPGARGGCAVRIDGAQLDPEADLVSDDVDYRAGQVELAGASFGVTSFMTQIDGLYLDTPGYRVMIRLDAPSTQRAAYVEVLLRR